MTELGVQQLAIADLRAAAWNPNRVSRRLLKKITRSIEEFGFVENLVVRAHPTEEGAYEVLSGNHRLEILRNAGVEHAPAVVVELDDNKARLLAQTMNRTRGRDDQTAYRALVSQLLESLSPQEIASFLPDQANSIAEAQGSGRESNIELVPIYGVIVDCVDEADQVALLTVLIKENRQCRALLA